MESVRNLIIHAQNGSVDSFGEIVRLFRQVAVRYAHAILRNRDLAEDAVQEAFVQAYLNLPRLAEPTAFPAWFRAIVHHCSHRLIRGGRAALLPLEHAEQMPSRQPGPAEAFEANEMARRVLAAVTKLPERERDVVNLFYFDGHSQREISGLLGVPVSTVNNRLHSSRTRLKRQAEIAALMPAEPPHKEAKMQLTYQATRRELLKGDIEITIRRMTREDIPAMRRLDDEIGAALDFANAQRPPGGESGAGGPWSDDTELTQHFDYYEANGNITILAEDESGKLVGFAELWATKEPEPFGASLDAECTDYLWEYYALGIETILLQEAETVARSAGLPALDIGTNTSSGDYPTYRRLGMKPFYEYDDVWCKCKPALAGAKPAYRVIAPGKQDTSGLVRIDHWAPTDFDFAHEPGRPGIHEFTVDGHRVIADLWRLWEPGYDEPTACELFAPPAVLNSSALLSKIANTVAYIAGEAGADEIPLPFPCDMDIDPTKLEVSRREFAFAWMRKRL